MTGEYDPVDPAADERHNEDLYDRWIAACIREAAALVELGTLTADQADYCTQYLDGEYSSLGHLAPTEALDVALDLWPVRIGISH